MAEGEGNDGLELTVFLVVWKRLPLPVKLKVKQTRKGKTVSGHSLVDERGKVILTPLRKAGSRLMCGTKTQPMMDTPCLRTMFAIGIDAKRQLIDLRVTYELLRHLFGKCCNSSNE